MALLRRDGDCGSGAGWLHYIFGRPEGGEGSHRAKVAQGKSREDVRAFWTLGVQDRCDKCDVATTISTGAGAAGGGSTTVSQEEVRGCAGARARRSIHRDRGN